MRKKYVRKIYSDSMITKLQEKIDMLGDYKYDAVNIMNIRFACTFMVFISSLYISKYGYIFSPFIALAFYSLFEYFAIDLPLNKRCKKLEHEALYFFEILTLTLESGRNLEKSLSVTIANVDSELSYEFSKALNEMEYGKTLIEALDDMKKRIPSITINNIILNMTQTSIFGNSILDTLYSQVDFLREKESLEIKTEINKIPNKISIVSVIFMVPLILILILGPFLLTYLGQM